MCQTALIRSGGVMEIRFFTNGLYSQTCLRFFCRTEKTLRILSLEKYRAFDSNPSRKAGNWVSRSPKQWTKKPKELLKHSGKSGTTGKEEKPSGWFQSSNYKRHKRSFSMRKTVSQQLFFGNTETDSFRDHLLVLWSLILLWSDFVKQ